MMSNQALKQKEEAKFLSDIQVAKQATYFALYALLEFIILVPVSPCDGLEPSPKDERKPPALLSGFDLRHMMNCLVKTGLL